MLLALSGQPTKTTSEDLVRDSRVPGFHTHSDPGLLRGAQGGPRKGSTRLGRSPRRKARHRTDARSFLSVQYR